MSPPSQPSPTGEGVITERGIPFPPGGNQKGGENGKEMKIMNIQKELYSSTQRIYAKIAKTFFINIFIREAPN
jgi:hypothetical protein